VRVADPLPHMKVGRYLRFKWSDVLAWLERQNRNQRRMATMGAYPVRYGLLRRFASCTL
jgi:hypothetical protein